MTTVLAPIFAPWPMVIGPEQLGARADRDVVLDRRVALAGREAGAAERHALVERHVVADLGRLADHDAHAVVDEEARRRSAPPGGSRCPVSARGDVGDRARHERHAGLVQRVGDAVGEQRVDAGPRWRGSPLGPTPRAAGSRSCAARDVAAELAGDAARGCRGRACAKGSPACAGALRYGREERRRDVALAGVGQDRDDPLARATPAAARPRARAHSAAPHEMPASTPSRRAQQRAPSRSRPRRRPAMTSSMTSRLSTGGHEARADALDLVRAGRRAREHRRRCRLDRDDARVGVALLEHLPHAGDRAAGPDAGDEARRPGRRAPRGSPAPVVRRWTSGLAGLENWSGRKTSSRSAIARAASTASFIPPSDSVTSTRAP